MIPGSDQKVPTAGIFVVLATLLATSCEVRGDILSSEGLGGSGPGAIFSGQATSLSMGSYHSCFVAEGGLYCFGNGSTGALGNGTTQDRPVPTRANSRTSYSTVTCGGTLSCALHSDGSVECTGLGKDGGSGAFTDRFEFGPVATSESITFINAGESHVCAIGESARLYCWGANAEGQLGQPDPFPGEGPPSSTPLEVPHTTGFRRVSAGQGHTCAIDTDGALYCWGRNTNNELGLGDGAADQLRTPQHVGTDADWSEVRAGQNHTCALKTDRSLWCWGNNESGQLGTGDTTSSDLPSRIASDVDALDLDTFHTCILRAGTVECTGRGDEGALGTGTLDQSTFQPAPLSASALELGVGRFHTCVATASRVLCTGQNDDGRLGVGDFERRSAFTEVNAPEAPP
jgi:alpha-tubulin suppressor-like RCC1 family protein